MLGSAFLLPHFRLLWLSLHKVCTVIYRHSANIICQIYSQVEVQGLNIMKVMGPQDWSICHEIYNEEMSACCCSRVGANHDVRKWQISPVFPAVGPCQAQVSQGTHIYYSLLIKISLSPYHAWSQHIFCTNKLLQLRIRFYTSKTKHFCFGCHVAV
jgi:hypothetical protein